jgi:hypothetical protein
MQGGLTMDSESKETVEQTEHGDGERKPYETPELTVYGKVENETCGGPGSM